jgi:hypothetical protein
MFQPNWPSSGVQVVMVKDSAACCNAVFFPPTVVAPGYFGYVGYHQFYLGVLGLHVVAFGRLTNTQQNSHPSKNIQGSHDEQTKQNHDQVQCSDMLYTGW